MDSDHVLVLFLALVLVVAAVALAYASPLVFGDGEQEQEVTDATLASFETTEPYCGDPDDISGSAVTQNTSQGEALVINQTVPLATNETAVNASIDEFGPQRYILEVTRDTEENETTGDSSTPTSGNEASGANEQGTPLDGEVTATPGSDEAASDEDVCHPEVQYNATIHMDRAGEYTVVVTYDDELVNAYWQDGDDSGSYGRLPDTPEQADPNNETAAEANVRMPADR